MKDKLCLVALLHEAVFYKHTISYHPHIDRQSSIAFLKTSQGSLPHIPSNAYQQSVYKLIGIQQFRQNNYKIDDTCCFLATSQERA